MVFVSPCNAVYKFFSAPSECGSWVREAQRRCMGGGLGGGEGGWGGADTYAWRYAQGGKAEFLKSTIFEGLYAVWIVGYPKICEYVCMGWSIVL